MTDKHCQHTLDAAVLNYDIQYLSINRKLLSFNQYLVSLPISHLFIFSHYIFFTQGLQHCAQKSHHQDKLLKTCLKLM